VSGGRSGLRAASRVAYDRWQRFADSRAALVLLFVWAFGEATVWPIIADFLLAPLALVRRSRLPALMSAILAGMTLGGVLTVLTASRAPGFAMDVLAHLPLVGDGQIRRARELLDERGVAGFLYQPYSGIPFKIWAVVAGERDLPPAQVIPAFVVARAGRMLATGVIAAIIGRIARPWLRDWFVLVVPAYLVLFAIGFAGTLG
jgi:membrane protein YqaA with SNARE-associated domain